MTPWITRLLVANIVVFGLSVVRPSIVDALAFVPMQILARPWTLFSYMFLHGDFGHIAFNMLGLFFFGPRLEAFLGGSRFLLLYFISGLVAAGVSFLFNPYTPIIGASGAIYGVFLGFANYWPREIIRIWGVIPIEARWMVLIMTALSLFGGFGVTADNVAHFAHLGGFAGAFIYLRWIDQQHVTIAPERAIPQTQVRNSDLERWAKIDREKLHEVNREELDRIREKIKRHGSSSLTFGELAFLDRFSSV